MIERLLWALSFLVATAASWSAARAVRGTGQTAAPRRLDRALWALIGLLVLAAGVARWPRLPGAWLDLGWSLAKHHQLRAHRHLLIRAAAVAAAGGALLGVVLTLAAFRASRLIGLAFAAAALLLLAGGLPAASFRARLALLGPWGPFRLRDLVDLVGLYAVAVPAMRAAGWLPSRARRSLAIAGVCALVPVAALGASAAARHGRPSAVHASLDRAFAEGVGGGFTDVGLQGAYFAGPNLEGQPVFERRDVRIDFDWGTAEKPGGSTSPGFADLGHDQFSVRWQGAVLPRFSEPYTFEVDADEGVRLAVRDAGAEPWQTIVDGWSSSGVRRAAPRPLTAGRPLQIELTYRQTGGPAHVRLGWSSASTPREVIEPLSTSGANVVFIGGGYIADLWADAMKGGRYRWTVPAHDEAVPVDADGWPLRDAENVVFEGAANTRGTYQLRFEGRARITTYPEVTFLAGGKVVGDSLPSGAGYDARTNVTTAEVRLAKDLSLLFLRFHDTRRTPDAGTNTGVRAVSLMRPLRPGAERAYPPGTLFVDGAKHVFGDGFTTVRWILNLDKNGDWKTRVGPTAAEVTHDNEPIPWEQVVMLANETGRDLYLSTPINATDDYLRNLARLIRFGSDGDGRPYGAPERAPRFPPLSSNLRLYLERSNEIWNWGFSQSEDNLRQARQAIAEGTPDGQIVDYDHAAGGAGWLRWHALKTKRLADTFADVFGAGALGRRVRVLYEYQYDDQQGTASGGLAFLERYFDNADGQHVPEPKPLAAYLWGAGAATYYGSGNPTGKQSAVQVPDGGFERPAGGSPWTFRGSAGVYQRPPVAEALRARPAGAASLPSAGAAAATGFTVGARPLAVYELGRLTGPGDTRPRGVRIVRAADRAPICDEQVEPHAAGAGAWSWTRLAHPVVLAANTGYAVISEEPDGAYLSPAADAAPDLRLDGGADLGPANFRYAVPVDGPLGAPPAPVEGRQAAFITGQGAIETTLDFGSGGSYAVQYLAAGKPGAVDPLDFYLDDQRVTSVGGGHDPRVAADPFQGGRWAYDGRDLLPYTTVPRPLAGKHRLRIVGRGHAGETTFLDDLTVVSVDALFAGGMPAGGQATGQTAVADWRRQMNAQARYPRAFGLHTVGYEGGWSVGGDFQTTVLESAAKFLDPRTTQVNDQAQAVLAAAGYDLQIWGTYDQWPTSFAPLARGLDYPLTLSITEGNNRLWPRAGGGRPIPAEIAAAAASWSLPGGGKPGRLYKAGDLIAFDLYAERSGRFDVSVDGAGTGTARLAIDGGLAFSGDLPVGPALRADRVFLAAGRHSVVVTSLGAATLIRSVAVRASAGAR
ncbi:MAG TPA: PA14 domain-containing protein [Polyangia bacterium]|jgi:hypothetical protein